MKLEKITDRIYRFPCDDYSDRPNIAYIKGDKASLLFDAGNSEKHAELIRADLRELGLRMPNYVAVSHCHWDHTFGLHAWDAVTIAGRKTNARLEEMLDWGWSQEEIQARIDCGKAHQFTKDMMGREYDDPSEVMVVKADVEFDGTMVIDLGGVHCWLIHVAGPHAADSVILFVEEEKFAFLGDSNGKDMEHNEWHFDLEHEDELLINLGKIPYDMEKVKAYIDTLNKYDFERCFGGHAGMMTREQLYATLK